MHAERLHEFVMVSLHRDLLLLEKSLKFCGNIRKKGFVRLRAHTKTSEKSILFFKFESFFCFREGKWWEIHLENAV